MRYRKMAYVLGAVLAVSVPMTAGAATVTNSFDSDTDKGANFTGNEFGRAEARWGNNPNASGDWELGVVPSGTNTPDEEDDNVSWGDLGTFDWSLDFSPGSGTNTKVSFQVGSNNSVAADLDLSGASSILLRLVSGGNTDIDWTVDGESVTGDGNANYYNVFGVDLTTGSLSGTGEMLGGTAGSRPGVQFKFTDVDEPGQAIPVPASIGLLGVGLMALGVVGRRRQKAS
jgi:hypothetical protein